MQSKIVYKPKEIFYQIKILQVIQMKIFFNNKMK